MLETVSKSFVLSKFVSYDSHYHCALINSCWLMSGILGLLLFFVFLKIPSACSYCECFAAGVYCVEPCSCQECFNKPIHEDTVLATRKQIESRNPLAFAPKVIRSSDS